MEIKQFSTKYSPISLFRELKKVAHDKKTNQTKKPSQVFKHLWRLENFKDTISEHYSVGKTKYLSSEGTTICGEKRREKDERKQLKKNYYITLAEIFQKISNMQSKHLKSCIPIKASYSEMFPVATYYKEMLQKNLYNSAYVSFNSCASVEIKLFIRKKW